jgi:hypothetical protein
MSKKKKDLPLDAQDGEKCANCDEIWTSTLGASIVW